MKHFLLTISILATCFQSFSQVQFTVDKLPQMKSELPKGSLVVSSQCVQVGKIYLGAYYVLTIMDQKEISNAGMVSRLLAHDAILGEEEINGLLSFFKYYKDTLMTLSPLKSINVDYKFATTLKNRPLYCRCSWDAKEKKWKFTIDGDTLYKEHFDLWLSQMENARNLIIQNTKQTDFSEELLELFKDIKFVNSLISDPSKADKLH